MDKRQQVLLQFALIFLCLTCCDQTAERPEGWTEETHGSKANPNYDVVFPRDKVNRIDITLKPIDWQMMMWDMTAILGRFGKGTPPILPQGHILVHLHRPQ